MTIEHALQQIQRIFGKNWPNAKIDEKNYPFKKECTVNNTYKVYDLNISIANGVITAWNHHGKIASGGKFANPALTTAPEEWYIEVSDDILEHSIWPIFEMWYNKRYPSAMEKYIPKYLGNTGNSNFIEPNCNEIKITLQQWHELVYRNINHNIINPFEWYFMKMDDNQQFLVNGVHQVDTFDGGYILCNTVVRMHDMEVLHHIEFPEKEIDSFTYATITYTQQLLALLPNNIFLSNVGDAVILFDNVDNLQIDLQNNEITYVILFKSDTIKPPNELLNFDKTVLYRGFKNTFNHFIRPFGFTQKDLNDTMEMIKFNLNDSKVNIYTHIKEIK